MGTNVGATIGTVLRLDPAVTAGQITTALAAWLKDTYKADLAPCDRDGLTLEWRLVDGAPIACQLVVSDLQSQTRRTILIFCDESGAVAIIEEAPFARPDLPHAVVDLSRPIQLLLSLLLPISETFLDFARIETHNLSAADPVLVIGALQHELSPGLLIAVTAEADDGPSSVQQAVLEGLVGLAVTASACADAPLLSSLGLSTAPRPGSIVSIARTADRLEAQVIASASVRSKPDSARRLVVRRQLSAPVPFDLERRRSAAMTRLLATDSAVDLPTALQLLDDESQRANELANRVKELETALDRAYEEQDSALGELDNAQSQVRYLQKAFKELGELALVEAEDDDDWKPDSSVDALVAAKESLPFLVIGADDSTCSALDAQQKRAIWAKKIWNSLRALNDYCRAKAEGRFTGDIAMYRDNPPDGAIPLLAEYAPCESKSTSDDGDLVAARTFKVPEDVHPAGKAYMQQHVKIDKGGQSAPRIHLHDGSDGPRQRVYIGYVGPHLPTAGGF